MTKQKDQYTDDAPIVSRNGDRFNRWPFAERIAHVIATRTDPSSLVIGLYGPWGDGKTSVLNMMAEALTGNEDVVLVSFNPWHFEDERQLIRAFFDTLADALQKKLTKRSEDVGKFLSKYGGLLSLASVSVAGVATLSPGKAASEIGDRLSNVTIDELKGRLSDILVESGKRVVVLIDDIDRLDRGEIHALLKLIKLSAGFANTAYVLAFDDDMVSASLGERYGRGDVEAGRQFLEKIIQVPLHLPDAENVDLKAICFEGVDEVLAGNGIELTQEDAEAFVRHFTIGIMPALHTPRQVKRYINAIRFAVPLLKDEVHIVDQLLIEAIRTAYRDLYLSIRENCDVYTGRRLLQSFGDGAKAKAATKETIEAGLTGLTGNARDGVVDLLQQLFPRLKGIFGNYSYGHEWDKTWATERRATSPSYFRRYFQYSVPTRDIADGAITDLINAANAGTVGALLSFVDDITQRKAWSRALDKLYARIKQFDAAGATVLALTLARHADRIPEEQGPFAGFMSAPKRAAGLVADLVELIPSAAARVDVAITIMNESATLSFAVDSLSWMSPKKDPSITTALSEEGKTQVGAVLASRISKGVIADPIFAHFGRSFGTLLWIWKTYGPQGDMVAFLTDRLNQHADEAVRFLDVFAGRAWGLETGLSHKHDFDRSEFDATAHLIDPEIIAAALRTTFGEGIADCTFDKSYELEGDVRTACRFMAILRKVREEQAAAAAAVVAPAPPPHPAPPTVQPVATAPSRGEAQRGKKKSNRRRG